MRTQNIIHSWINSRYVNIDICGIRRYVGIDICRCVDINVIGIRKYVGIDICRYVNINVDEIRRNADNCSFGTRRCVGIDICRYVDIEDMLVLRFVDMSTLILLLSEPLRKYDDLSRETIHTSDSTILLIKQRYSTNNETTVVRENRIRVH